MAQNFNTGQGGQNFTPQNPQNGYGQIDPNTPNPNQVQPDPYNYYNQDFNSQYAANDPNQGFNPPISTPTNTPQTPYNQPVEPVYDPNIASNPQPYIDPYGGQTADFSQNYNTPPAQDYQQPYGDPYAGQTNDFSQNYNIPPTPTQDYQQPYGDPNNQYAYDNPDPAYFQNQSLNPEVVYDSQGYGQQMNYEQGAVPPQNQEYYPNTINDPNQPPANTFEVKKSGNRFLLLLTIILVVGLALASGILFFLNQRRNTDTSTTQSTNSSQSSSSNSSSDSSQSSIQNDSNSTPAELAKVRNAQSVPDTWRSQKFVNNGVDATGKCTNQSICGDGSDPDLDGLTNLEEYNYDTDPQNGDTDNDGLSDGDEVFIYFTNPTQKDSDRDGIADFQELVACTDPIKSVGTKMETARLDAIAKITELKSLKEASVKSFRANASTEKDITKGYLEKACPVTSGGTSSTTSSGANSSTSSSTSSTPPAGGANVDF